MSTSSGWEVTSDQFRTMAEVAGLGMSEEELEELKPLYDLHAPYLRQLHSLELGAEEISLSFHPDWTAC